MKTISLRWFYLAFLMTVSFIVMTVCANAQTVYPATGSVKGSNRFAGELIADSNFVMPLRTSPTHIWNWTPGTRKLGASFISKTDSLPYYYNGVTARRPVFFIDTLTHKIVSGNWLWVNLTWDSIRNKPTVFPVAAHTHPQNQVIGLPDSLAARYTTTQADLLFVEQTQVGVANGVASLNNAGVVPLSQLPNGIFIYKGTWNVSTNTPPLTNGVGTNGDVYVVTGGPGTHNFGAGPVGFVNGDRVAYNGTIWQKWTSSDQVVSVNGLQGVVVLTTDDIPQGVTNKYYANALVSAYLSGTQGITEVGGIIGNDSLRLTGPGLLRVPSNPNIFMLDTMTYMDWDSIMNWVNVQITNIGTAPNFFTTDLTATADRNHDMANHELAIDNMGVTSFALNSTGIFQVSQSAAGPLFKADVNSGDWIVKMGDANNVHNSQNLTVDDGNSNTTLQTDSFTVKHSAGAEQMLMLKTGDAIIGDAASIGNGTRSRWRDALHRIDMLADSVVVGGKIKLGTADNNVALSGFDLLVRNTTTNNIERKSTLPYTYINGISAGAGISYLSGVIANTGVLSINGVTGAFTNILQNGGNTFAGAITAGTNDNFALNFETNGTTKVAIGTNGSTTMSSTLASSSGIDIGLNVTPTINGSGSQGYTALNIASTETATGSGAAKFFNAAMGASNRYSIYNTGATDITTATLSGSSGILYGLRVSPSFSVSGTAGWNAFEINATNGSSGSGLRQLINAKTGGTTAFAVDYGGQTYVASNMGVGTTYGSNPVSGLQVVYGSTPHAAIFTGNGSASALGVGTDGAGAFVQGYNAAATTNTTNLQIAPYGGRVLLGGGTDNTLDKLQVAGGILATGLKLNTGNQAVGKIWMGNNSNGAGDWSSAYVTAINGSNGSFTNIIQNNGNTFGTNIVLGTNDNNSVFFEINNSSIGGWSNQLAGGALLVGTTIFDATSNMRLQVNGGIKATAATYSTGGYTHLRRNTTTGNFESSATLPLIDGRITRRAVADANTSATSADYLIVYTSLTATRTVALPSPGTMTDMFIVVKDESGSAGSFPIKVSGTLEGGVPTIDITTAYGYLKLYSNGTRFFKID